MPQEQPFHAATEPQVRGYLHTPDQSNNQALVLSHGAGSNAQAPLLIALAEAFSNAGYTVLRIDLPFRHSRSYGPPSPAGAAQDRAGIKNALAEMRKLVTGRIFVGGHSYGGRQSSMLCAEDSSVADALLLLSYPLHPPRKLEQLRTQHLTDLRTPTLFVHGTIDPFGSPEEIAKAIKLIPAKTKLLTVEGAGHDLGFKGKATREALPSTVLTEFEAFLG